MFDRPMLSKGLMKKLWILCCAAASLASGCRNPDRPASGASPASKPLPPFVQNLDAASSERLLREHPEVRVLDVRTPEEFAAGHLAGAYNIDYFNPNFREKAAHLDKTKPYLIHCATGRRSALAREVLRSLNFHALYHLDGGIKAWEKAGYPVQRSP